MKDALPALTLEKPVYGGDCLGHVDGKAFFIPLTLPGEAVQAHVTESKRTFARAEADRILSPSPHRVDPRCPYFGVCGGCRYQHADYPTQLAWKTQILRELLTRGEVPFSCDIDVLSAHPWEYRNRIRLALTADAAEATALNYRSRRSHHLVSIRECPIAASLLVDVALRCAAWISAHPAPIVEIELFTNHDQSQLLLTLFTESDNLPFDPQPWLTSLHAALPGEVTGLRLQSENGSLTPPILGSAGQSALTYTVAGFDYQVDHGAFFQVNRRLLDDFVELVLRDLPPGRAAWDLYAGVGLFARQLAARFDQVVAVESAPASLPSLQRNLADTPSRAVAATTLEHLRRNRELREPRPDLIVLDPPRAGLGDNVTTLLNAIGAPTLVYVSCDPTTLARDLRALTRERYVVDSITMADMFPQTFHLESVVRLCRA